MHYSLKLLILYIIAALCAMVYNYVLRRKGLEGISYVQCFNPIKLISVWIGFTLWLLVPMHIFEQYVLRFYDPECRTSCLLGNDGSCVKCGCNTTAKMWSPLEKDSNYNWGKIIFSRRKYRELRNKYPVKIKIEYTAK